MAKIPKKFHPLQRSPTKKPPFTLQERDIEIIKLVYNFRFLNSEQISRLINTSPRVTNRRLQKLFHHSFLDRPRNQPAFYIFGRKKMIYALGDKGADILTERLSIDRGKIDWQKKNREVQERYLDHGMMLSNFRTCLTLSLKDNPETKIHFFYQQHIENLRDKIQTPSEQLLVNPDAFFSLKDKDDLLYFFLEADQSTMTNERFFKKLKAYLELFKQQRHIQRYKIPSFRVLTITKSEERKQNLINTTKRLKDFLILFWFTTEQNYNLNQPETILENIWQTSEDDQYHSILE